MDDYLVGAADYSFMRRSRIAAVQMLYQIEFYNFKKTPEEIYKELFAIYKSELPEKPAEKILNKELIFKIVEQAIAKKKDILQRLAKELKDDWTIDEMQMHLGFIIRLAIAELMTSDTDLPVILNEYIEITKIYESSSEAKFVNSVIETIGKEIRKA